VAGEETISPVKAFRNRNSKQEGKSISITVDEGMTKDSIPGYRLNNLSILTLYFGTRIKFITQFLHQL
jgi:hypothetical protein